MKMKSINGVSFSHPCKLGLQELRVEPPCITTRTQAKAGNLAKIARFLILRPLHLIPPYALLVPDSCSHESYRQLYQHPMD